MSSLQHRGKGLHICPPEWIRTRWRSSLSSKRAWLQRFELISDPCSLLAERPRVPGLDATWHIFNKFVTFFLFSWIYIRAAGVSGEASITTSPLLSDTAFKPQAACFSLTDGDVWGESWSVNPAVMTQITLCVTHGKKRKIMYTKFTKPQREVKIRTAGVCQPSHLSFSLEIQKSGRTVWRFLTGLLKKQKS